MAYEKYASFPHLEDADDIQNVAVIATMAIKRQLGSRKPTVVEVARYTERAFRTYLGGGSEGPFNEDQKGLINDAAIKLLVAFDVVSP